MIERRAHPRRTELTEAEAARVADVFQTHHRFIENVARQHAISDDAVPDIVQGVGMQICLGLNGFRGESELRTWLYRVTVNQARDNYHRERRQQRTVEAVIAQPMPDKVEDPDQNVLCTERLDALREAVERLRPPYRVAIETEIRNQTGPVDVQTDQETKEATLKTRRWRGRQALKSILAEDPRVR